MSKEFKIGLIVLISGAVLYYGFNFLKGSDFFSSSSRYYVIYENVDGLTKSNPVVVNGLTVGKVSDIDLLQNRENDILVEITLNEDIILGDSTVADLANSDFLGSKAIVLNIGSLSSPLEPGDTLIAKVDKGLEQYLESVTPITNNLSITISRINEILLGLQGSGEKINNTLSELEITTREVNSIIRNNKNQLKTTLENSNRLIENIDKEVALLDPILRKSSGVLDSLNNLELQKTVNGVNDLLAQLNSTLLKMESEEGTLGKLMSNDSVYNNLNKLLVDLDKLAIHFNQYPKDFLKPLGRKHKKLKGIPENEK